MPISTFKQLSGFSASEVKLRRAENAVEVEVGETNSLRRLESSASVLSVYLDPFQRALQRWNGEAEMASEAKLKSYGGAEALSKVGQWLR
jgi:hypothetical protein